MRGVTATQKSVCIDIFISTHTPHARRDNVNLDYLRIVIVFQLTRLMRGVTYGDTVRQWERLAISTHTPHARRDSMITPTAKNRTISTHTPHARRDIYYDDFCCRNNNFNSHASCEA